MEVWVVNQAPEIPLAIPTSSEACVITVALLSHYLLIMTTHSDAGCLTMPPLNCIQELMMEFNLVLLGYSVNVGDFK